jgi:hypothetical protein
MGPFHGSKYALINGGSLHEIAETRLMSWDLFIQDIPAAAQNVGDIPDDFHPAPLGSRAAIIAKIREVAPLADFSDPPGE